jgi:TonB-dependent SusC/RagA subfamily outer membrane receptor
MKIVLISFVFIALSCATSQNQTTKEGSINRPSTNKVSATNPSLSLADYLKRIPGVQIVESGGGNIEVLVRGNNTVNDQREPLFVINGVNVGFGYENAAPLVAVSDIDYVRVLKSGSETAQYGMQGTNGVILITTKKGNK